MPSRLRSTHDHARSSAGEHLPKPSMSTYAPSNKPVLLPPIESTKSFSGLGHSFRFSRRQHCCGGFV